MKKDTKPKEILDFQKLDTEVSDRMKKLAPKYKELDDEIAAKLKEVKAGRSAQRNRHKKSI